ncbi:MAG: DUF2092 domain-containing protein [Deltaproteobacteria bacterium]|nr:DUF2092 domain-containing protein [Deltaproteobacteria bacterium]
MRGHRWLTSTLVAAALAGPPAFAAQPQGTQAGVAQQAVVEPQADQVLRKMSDYLKGQQSFTFDTNSTQEAVTTEGQKLDFESAQQVAVRRPDKLRSERKGPATATEFLYNGKDFTVYGQKSGFYATAPAPAQLDQAIDAARAKFNIDAPAADLLVSDPYTALMNGVTEGRYVGLETLNGARVHHLAFRGKDADFQLWVDAGDQAIPRKFEITSKDVAGQPEYSVNISNWKSNASLPDSFFNFQPPAGAQRVPLEPGSTAPTP